MHVHVAGGGGEASFSSRTPEALTSELISAGITTVVGTTGTDSFSRSQAGLQAKAAALREDGLTAYTWCGGYSLPPATATGSIRGDISLLPDCLGVGEVAVGDQRGFCPTPRQLAGLACEVRTAGLLSGKAGLVHCHMGAGRALLQPLRDAAAASGGVLHLNAFHPTHVSRSPELAADGAEWLDQGGTLDLTVSGGRGAAAAAADALDLYRARGLPLGRVTLSTDAYGSLPRFDARGALVSYDMARPAALMDFLRLLVRERGWALETALALATAGPAHVLGLQRKGRLAPGADADVLLLDPGTLDLRFVVARGRLVKTPAWVRGGVFERGPGVRPRHPWPQPGA